MKDDLPQLLVRHRGLCEYEQLWREMRTFTEQRQENTPDEIWLVEHPPVYTLGQAGNTEHLLQDNGIPLVRTDRGGQITYHGPGQVVLYTMLNLSRYRLKVKELVARLEQAIIDTLFASDVLAERIKGAPGVYVNGAKIAAIGLRVKRQGTYHGLSLNVDMDLSPFASINPCGYADLPVTQTRNHGLDYNVRCAGEALCEQVIAQLEAATGRGSLGDNIGCGVKSETRTINRGG